MRKASNEREGDQGRKSVNQKSVDKVGEQIEDDYSNHFQSQSGDSTSKTKKVAIK